MQKIAKTRDDYINLLPGGCGFQENIGGSYKPPSVPTLLEEKQLLFLFCLLNLTQMPLSLAGPKAEHCWQGMLGTESLRPTAPAIQGGVAKGMGWGLMLDAKQRLIQQQRE